LERFSNNAMVMERVVGESIKNVHDLFDETLMKASELMDDFDRENLLEFKPCVSLSIR